MPGGKIGFQALPLRVSCHSPFSASGVSGKGLDLTGGASNSLVHGVDRSRRIDGYHHIKDDAVRRDGQRCGVDTKAQGDIFWHVDWNQLLRVEGRWRWRFGFFPVGIGEGLGSRTLHDERQGKGRKVSGFHAFH